MAHTATAPAAHVVRASVRERFVGLRLLQSAIVARTLTGKALSAQVREMIALRRGPGRLRPFDYYAFELYDDRRYSFAEKQEFVSWRWQDVSTLLNNPEWTAVCDDKLLTYGLLRVLGLPYPQVYAVFHPGTRTCGPMPVLRTPDAMAEFLRCEMPYPFFGKPVRDWRGGGASSVDALDPARDVLRLSIGEEIGVEEYVRQVPMAQCHGQNRPAPEPAGYLFQERIRQHSLIERITGGRVSTLRLVVLLWPDGPRVHRAKWKLAVGKNIIDHSIPTTGNVKCSIDLVTGRVEWAVDSTGPGGTPYYGLGARGARIEYHPDTHERLTGIDLPYWERTVSLCLHAAAALPGVRYQAWDIAMAPDGPLLLEVNRHGTILQIPGGRGFNDAEFRRLASSIDRA